MSVTDEIKSRLDIVNYIQGYVSLKKAGRSYKGLCPFHSEKTPSFVIFPDSQTWRCFGACGEGGDIFTFHMKHEGLDFSGALAELAERAGIELAPPSPQQTAAQEARDRLRGLLSLAADYYRDVLLNAPQAAHARAYVDERGLTADTVEQFGLGYALDSWDAARQALLAEGYELADLVAAGLLVEKDDGGTYDRFRDRLMIPIRDARGRVIGFGARALKPDAVPKYLNSPQTPLFDKSRNLFGLSHARRAIREDETVIIVEGYMDVMQAHQAGFTNVVAQMGTALTEAQLKTLRRYASRFILALDSDVAGAQATLRGFDTARAALDQQSQPSFDTRGMVTYEAHLDAEIRVLLVPEGMDPDDLIRQSPERWQTLIEEAVPVVEYAIRVATEGRNLDDPKIKKQVVREVSPLIDDIADSTERDYFRQRLARLLKVDERALLVSSAATAITARVRTRRQFDETQPVTPEPAEVDAYFNLQAAALPRETRCLAVFIRLPNLLYKADRLMKRVAKWPGEGRWDTFAPQDFAHPEHQAIFSAWRDALKRPDVKPLDHLRTTLDDVLLARLDAVLEEEHESTFDVADQDRISGETLNFALEMRERRLTADMQSLKFLAQDAHEDGDLTASRYQETIKSYIQARQNLQQVMSEFATTGEWAVAGLQL